MLSKENDSELYSIDDICQILGITRATAKNWIRLGRLHPLNNRDLLFHSNEIRQLLIGIKTGQINSLKSRRNKNNISGIKIYSNYVNSTINTPVLQELISEEAVKSKNDLIIIMANFAIQLYYQKLNIDYIDNDVLYDFLEHTRYSEFHKLITDLLKNCSSSIDEQKKRLQPALSKKILFIEWEDTLGFIYISLKDIGERKHSGIFYTPAKIVTQVVNIATESSSSLDTKILDPCCGTGNFLIELCRRGISIENLYGQDIDSISVCLSRINIALNTPQFSATHLKKHITDANFYFYDCKNKFDIIIGNPPWGSSLSEEEKRLCKRTFLTASLSNNFESYNLFIEKSLSMLTPKGILTFILPEAILNVASHSSIRKIILDSCSFQTISFLKKNTFSNVQCPAIILKLSLKQQKKNFNCKVITEERIFTISKKRIASFSEKLFPFHLSDDENLCLEKISGIKNSIYLKNNARFALGIVTGNNQKFITSKKQIGYETVYKGSDIFRYSIKEPTHFIKFLPESFQQTAPEELYRAEEKLFYRFICNTPVFAYDCNKRLSLNSCNILIPQIQGVHIKYILAILNSSIAAFFCYAKFNSVKILRTHIEQIPIPMIPEKEQKNIITKVNKIMDASENTKSLYFDLDTDIINLYNISPIESTIIQNTLKSKNLFLRK